MAILSPQAKKLVNSYYKDFRIWATTKKNIMPLMICMK
jgi:hypothetical protein